MQNKVLRGVIIIDPPYIYIYTSVLSSTAFTYSYVFKIGSFELSECDRTLISLCCLSQTLSVQIICILLKTDLMVVSVSSANKDAEKTFDSFNRMHMIWRDRV